MTRTLEILEQLVAFPTVSSASNLNLIDFAQELLQARGVSTRRINDQSGQKAGLYAEIGPQGPGVLLSAHSDVVPTTGQTWTKPSFKLTREADRVFGRGTTDMKGFLAAALALAERASTQTLKEPLKLCISYDEEVGCLGIREMMGALAPLLGRPRFCLVGEPTEMHVAIGHKGKVALRAICHGQAGHSSLAPNFVNALDPAADFILALRSLQADIAHNGNRDTAYTVPFSTIHVGRLIGGVALNMMPVSATLDFEYRHIAEDSPDQLEQRIALIAGQISAQYHDRFNEPLISISRVNSYPGLATAQHADVVNIVRALSNNQQTLKVAFGTEAGFFDALGIPTVVCGPGSMENQGHKPDEHITLDQLAACDTMLERLLVQLTA